MDLHQIFNFPTVGLLSQPASQITLNVLYRRGGIMHSYFGKTDLEYGNVIIVDDMAQIRSFLDLALDQTFFNFDGTPILKTSEDPKVNHKEGYPQPSIEFAHLNGPFKEPGSVKGGLTHLLQWLEEIVSKAINEFEHGKLEVNLIEIQLVKSRFLVFNEFLNKGLISSHECFPKSLI